jgi:hypothetical protein
MSGDRVFSLIGAGSGAVGITAAILAAAAIGRRTTRGIRGRGGVRRSVRASLTRRSATLA